MLLECLPKVLYGSLSGVNGQAQIPHFPTTEFWIIRCLLGGWSGGTDMYGGGGHHLLYGQN